MRYSVFLTILSLAAAIASPALAQSMPPMPSPNPQMRQQFEATHQQMVQIHEQARSQMLGALTPAHRQLLATIAGQLAASTTPDYKGAAARLDAALSASEKQAIMSAAQSEREKMRAQMQTMRQQMSQMMPPPGGPGGPGKSGGPMAISGGPEGGRTRSAGEILLRTAMSGGGMEMHMHGSMRQH